MIACAGVRAALERRYPDCRTIGELELCRDEREQGRRLASVESTGEPARRRSHSPDLVIWPPTTPDTPATPDAPASPDTPATPPLPVAVEVELTIKAKAELMANCRAWARCRYVEAVIYFAETREYRGKAARCDRGVQSRGADRGESTARDPQPSAGIPPHRRVAGQPAAPHTAAPPHQQQRGLVTFGWRGFCRSRSKPRHLFGGVQARVAPSC